MSSGARTVDSFRHVIPRWRATIEAITSIESAHPGAVDFDRNRVREEFETRRFEYEIDPNPGTLMDLMSAAVVLGQEVDVYDEARRISEDSQSYERTDAVTVGVETLAQAILRMAAGEDRSLDLEYPSEPAAALRRLRRLIKRDPRNVMAWLDSGLAYTTLGQMDQAAHAIEISLKLAPDNRLVLRSSARFFIHSGHADRAHAIIDGADRTPSDPWLSSTLVSTALITGGRLPRARYLQRLVEDSPIEHATELLSSLGTADLSGGSERRAVRRFHESLRAPTENVLAQVEWVSNRTGHLIDVDPRQLSEVEDSFEASARHFEHEGDPASALVEAERWMRYQPFSIEAAAYASYIASVGLADFGKAAELTLSAPGAIMRDRYLANNRAFALANLDRIEDARAALELVSADVVVADPHLLATSGLIAYRSGDVESGRLLYERALALSRNVTPPYIQALIGLFWAREELKSAVVVNDLVLTNALRLSEHIQHPFVEKWRREVADAPREESAQR